MMATAMCPKCQEILESEDDIAGQSIACPSCGHEFICQEKKQPVNSAKKFITIKKPIRSNATPPANHSPSSDRPSDQQQVTITDINIPFGSLFILTVQITVVQILLIAIIAAIVFFSGCAAALISLR